MKLILKIGENRVFIKKYEGKSRLGLKHGSLEAKQHTPDGSFQIFPNYLRKCHHKNSKKNGFGDVGI